MEKGKEKSLVQETNNREGHMCVNPNICDICNGIATTQDKLNPADALIEKVANA